MRGRTTRRILSVVVLEQPDTTRLGRVRNFLRRRNNPCRTTTAVAFSHTGVTSSFAAGAQTHLCADALQTPFAVRRLTVPVFDAHTSVGLAWGAEVSKISFQNSGETLQRCAVGRLTLLMKPLLSVSGGTAAPQQSRGEMREQQASGW